MKLLKIRAQRIVSELLFPQPAGGLKSDWNGKNVRNLDCLQNFLSYDEAAYLFGEYDGNGNGKARQETVYTVLSQIATTGSAIIVDNTTALNAPPA